MKKLDIKRKRKFEFSKMPICIDEELYSIVSDCQIILKATELCEKNNLKLLGIYTNPLGKVNIIVNGYHSDFNLFVAEMCKEFTGRIGGIEF